MGGSRLGEIRPSLTGWLDRPTASKGLHVLRSGEWEVHPYDELASRASAIAPELRRVAAGCLVGLCITEPADFTAAFFGCLAAGCSALTIAPPRLLGSESSFVGHVAYQLAAAQPPLLVCSDGLVARLGAAAEAAGSGTEVATVAELLVGAGATVGPAGLHRDDTAMVQFTSGSSGPPRAVCVSRRNLEANLEAIGTWLDLQEDDSSVTWLPFHHDMGLVGGLLTPVIRQSDVWIMRPEQFVTSPGAWVECLLQRGVSITMAPSFGYGYAAAKVPADRIVGDASAIKAAIVGAERLDAVALWRFQRLLAPAGFSGRAFRPAYGLAEATLAVTGAPLDVEAGAVRLGFDDGEVTVLEQRPLSEVGDAGAWLLSSGTALPGVAVAVVDDTGEPVGPGVVGEIEVRGPSVARPLGRGGAAVPSEADERLLTGDAGIWWNDELYVLGRMGDSIKVRGRTVYSEDLEAKLAEAIGCGPTEVVVLAEPLAGRPSLAVLVVAKDDAWQEDAALALAGELGADVAVCFYRCSRRALLRTTSGKIRRRPMGDLLRRDELDVQRVG